MSKILYKFSFFAMIILVMASCKKDEVKVTTPGGTIPSLNSTAQSAVLLKDETANEAYTLNWTKSDYGYSSVIKYTLQMDTDNSFATPKAYDMGAGLTRPFTVGEMNDYLIAEGIVGGDAADVYYRVIASVGNNQAQAISNVVTVHVTTFSSEVKLYYIWVPGSHQGWAPDAAPQLASVDEISYEGYVNFPDASTDFKFTGKPNWDGPNYGLGSTANTLSTSGGNITIAGSGYYRFKVDIPALTWSYAKTDWGIIGDATEGGWDNSTPMTYDPASKKWTLATASLTGGKDIKFRANNSWDINVGSDKGDGNLTNGGGNIRVAETGIYKIELDLSNPLKYKYAITKL